jgi:2-(1,2-epoxy-1,2-dihydrophenyl)acetyl-CoA isomerase
MALYVRTRQEDGGRVWVVEMARAQARNALDRPMRQALLEALDEARALGARAVVLTGEGPAFCAGQDLAELEEARKQGKGDLQAWVQREWLPLVEAVRSLTVPVVAAVNGVAAGGGLTLAMACDVRVAEPNTRLLPSFVQVGLVADTGLAHLLVRSVGLSRAMAWLLEGKALSAQEALAWGLVVQVAQSRDTLVEEAVAYASRLAALPAPALEGMKALVQAAVDLSFPQVVGVDAWWQGRLGRTREHQEAVAAFWNRRAR